MQVLPRTCPKAQRLLPGHGQSFEEMHRVAMNMWGGTKLTLLSNK